MGKFLYSRQYQVYKLNGNWFFDSINNKEENGFKYLKITPINIDTFFSRDKYLSKTFHKFLKKKYIGYFLINDYEWINYIWCANPFSPPPVHLTSLKDIRNLYWIFFCRTNEVYQNKGFYSRCLQLFCNQLIRTYNANPDNIFIDAESSSISANKAIINSGFIRYGEINLTRIHILPFIDIKKINWITG